MIIKNLLFEKISAQCIFGVGLILLVFVSCGTEPPEGKELFDRYFKVRVPAEERTSQGVAASTLRGQAFRLLDDGNYEQAAILFSELAVRERRSGYMMYRGAAQLAGGRAHQALASLQQVRRDDPLYLSSRWYVALAHLRLDDVNASKEPLRLVAQRPTEAPFQREAKELLDQIE